MEALLLMGQEAQEGHQGAHLSVFPFTVLSPTGDGEELVHQLLDGQPTGSS